MQRSGAIVQKPEGPDTYDLKIWLSLSGNLDLRAPVGYGTVEAALFLAAVDFANVRGTNRRHLADKEGRKRKRHTQ